MAEPRFSQNATKQGHDWQMMPFSRSDVDMGPEYYPCICHRCDVKAKYWPLIDNYFVPDGSPDCAPHPDTQPSPATPAERAKGKDRSVILDSLDFSPACDCALSLERISQAAQYRHYKGGLYEVVCRAQEEATGCEVVVYRNLSDGRAWTRPTTDFFATLPDGGLRFTLITKNELETTHE